MLMPIAATPFSQGSNILPIHMVMSLPTHLKSLNIRAGAGRKRFLSLQLGFKITRGT